MSEDEDTTSHAGTTAGAQEASDHGILEGPDHGDTETRYVQTDVEGRQLHEQMINVESWDSIYEAYCKISHRQRTRKRMTRPRSIPEGVTTRLVNY